MRPHLLDQSTARDRQPKHRDEGSSLILCLVVIIIGAFFVLPTMTYIMTVNQASRQRIEGANSSEVVRGGLRSVLYDPAALYAACANSGISDPSAINLAVPPGLAITTKCTTTNNAQQWLPADLRWALATTMAGSAATIPPAQPDGTISALWCTSAPTLPCGSTYPGSGSATTTAWLADATDSSIGSKVFLPYIPAVID
ncbi:MAG TPA: hypothetical protein VHN36_07615, partial [Ilumatobacteraceae bacterium]|nr:hypothetical protein [Ilumatobacteraceae bacterium]